MTPAFIRRAIFAFLAVLVMCGIAVWVRVPDPVTAARSVSARMERRGDTIEEVQAVAVSATSTPAEKLGALRFLFGRVDLQGRDARSDEVVTAMTRLFATTTNADARADILRQLDGVLAPALQLTLLEALRVDPSHQVREKAAEMLAGYITRAGVREALTHARDNDPNPRVVGMAHWVLFSHLDD